MVTAGAKARRKRPARKATLTAAEQTRQLRELAEDAARQSAARPPIGITSVTEEEEAQDKALSAERRGEAQPDAIVIVEGAVQHADDAGRKRRRRRRRGGRGRGLGEEMAATAAAPTVAARPAAPQPSEAAASDGDSQHRRRRRRRRGRGGRGRGDGAAPGAMPDRHIFEVFDRRQHAPDRNDRAARTIARRRDARAIHATRGRSATAQPQRARSGAAEAHPSGTPPHDYEHEREGRAGGDAGGDRAPRIARETEAHAQGRDVQESRTEGRTRCACGEAEAHAQGSCCDAGCTGAGRKHDQKAAPQESRNGRRVTQRESCLRVGRKKKSVTIKRTSISEALFII